MKFVDDDKSEDGVEVGWRGRIVEPPEPVVHSHRSIVGRVIFGAFCLLGWLVLWMVPGVVFNSSVSQVHSLCSTGLFVTASSCRDASTATWIAWFLFGAGLISLIIAAIRWHKNSTSPQEIAKNDYSNIHTETNMSPGFVRTEMAPPGTPGKFYRFNNELHQWEVLTADGAVVARGSLAWVQKEYPQATEATHV
jgi:hypothetical protein